MRSGTNRNIQVMIEKQVNKSKVVTMTSTNELLIWLSNLGADNVHKLCIVTNRYREYDGKDDAGENLILQVRRDPKWNKVPIMLFCGNKQPVQRLHNAKKLVMVTDSSVELLNFVLTSKRERRNSIFGSFMKSRK
jgi:hypothetical protein